MSRDENNNKKDEQVAWRCCGWAHAFQVWRSPALQEVRRKSLLADQLLLELSFSEPVSGFYRQTVV